MSKVINVTRGKNRRLKMNVQGNPRNNKYMEKENRDKTLGGKKID